MFDENSYLRIPGSGEKVYELPPLLMHSGVRLDIAKLLQNCLHMTRDELVASGCLQPDETQIYDLAETRLREYEKCLKIWMLGDAVWQWTLQCRETFRNDRNLQHVLQIEAWPFPDQSRLVLLLVDKKLTFQHASLPAAVGTRLKIPLLPQLRHLSLDYLAYGIEPSGLGMFYSWAEKAPSGRKKLPPERFSFQTVVMNSD